MVSCYAIRQTPSQIVHELIGGGRSACPNAPTRNQFRFRIERNPGPHIPIAKLALFIVGHVLVFGIAELPNLITLNPLTREVSQGLIVIRGAGCPERFQQSKNRYL